LFEKILLGYDGSSYSKKALDYALDLAKKYISSLTIACAIHVPNFSDSRDEINGALEDAQVYTEDILEKAKDCAAEAGIKVDTRITPGHPAEILTHLAEEGKYNLLIVADKGLSGVKRFLLGSVSEAVVRYAKCPVLIVKNKNV
jgi:nucleotide-binding universal stress UspA family protein